MKRVISVIVLCAILAGCASSGLTFKPTTTPAPVTPQAVEPTATLEPTETPPTPTAGATVAPTSAPTPHSAAMPGGKVVGVFTAAQDELAELAGYGINAVLVTLTPEEAVSYLEAAEAAHIRVIANFVQKPDMMDQTCLSASSGNSRAPSCPFDLNAYRAALDRYRGLDLDRFAGTSLYAHIMMDEPFDESGWGGRPIAADELRQANAYSKEVIGPDVPTLINAGFIPPGVEADLADIITSTFYANKERKFGSIGDYISGQMANLANARAGQPDLRYIIFLQAVGGGEYGAFPAADNMEAKALAACSDPAVAGVMWWTWHKDKVPQDFARIVHSPDRAAYVSMLSRVAGACGN